MELKSHQRPLSVDEQIGNLKSLGLVINDENRAREFLNDVSYFRLIKAYSLGLKIKNCNYNNEIQFEDIIELYLFNANFRQLIFPIIEKIEINLRCRLANYFSCEYGIFGYEKVENFTNPVFYDEFYTDYTKEISRNSNAPFVKNFCENYCESKLPFYALVELLSFGALSKFFKNMKNRDKKMVAQSFNVGYTYFESWIENISFVRNICAHYGRLYNAKLPKTPMLYGQYSDKGIKNNRVYATLLCMKHLVPNDKHWTQIVEEIKLLFIKYPKVEKKLIGFPDNWYEYMHNL